MRVEVVATSARKVASFDKESLEKACCETVIDHLEYFSRSPLSFSEDGENLVYAVGGRKFRFSVEITLEGEVT